MTEEIDFSKFGGMTDREIADATGVLRHRVTELRKQSGVSRFEYVGSPHGSGRRYALGCRCLKCREAKGIAAAKVAANLPPSGKRMSAERSAALAELARQHQAKTLKAATSHYRAWSDEDLAVALDYSLTAAQAAKQLGRTLSSIRHKRANHKARPERLPYRMRDATAAAAAEPLVREWKAIDRQVTDARWQQKAETVAEFRRRHGRVPQVTIFDKTERALGKWLSVQRQSAKGKGSGKWTAAREQWLDANVEGWRL